MSCFSFPFLPQILQHHSLCSVKNICCRTCSSIAASASKIKNKDQNQRLFYLFTLYHAISISLLTDMLSKWISWLHGHTTSDTRVAWMIRDVQRLYVSCYVGFVSRFSATFHAFPILGLSQEHLGRYFFLNRFKNQSWNIEHYGDNSSTLYFNNKCLQSMMTRNMLP